MGECSTISALFFFINTGNSVKMDDNSQMDVLQIKQSANYNSISITKQFCQLTFNVDIKADFSVFAKSNRKLTNFYRNFVFTKVCAKIFHFRQIFTLT
jgi:hypothetical protein